MHHHPWSYSSQYLEQLPFTLLSPLPSTPNPPSSPAHFASKRYMESIAFSALLTITTLVVVTTTSWLASLLLLLPLSNPWYTAECSSQTVHWILLFPLDGFSLHYKIQTPIHYLLLDHHQPLWHLCKNQPSTPSLDKYSLGQGTGQGEQSPGLVSASFSPLACAVIHGTSRIPLRQPWTSPTWLSNCISHLITVL